MEQVLYWNPDYIFTTDFKKQTSAFSKIKAGGQWQNISAVKAGRVYEVPSVPLGWIDNPPLINRIHYTVIFEIRLPRIIAAVLVGGALSAVAPIVIICCISLYFVGWKLNILSFGEKDAKIG